jgi:hypothetical protein
MEAGVQVWTGENFLILLTYRNGDPAREEGVATTDGKSLEFEKIKFN